jgi:hypothetical protein
MCSGVERGIAEGGLIVACKVHAMAVGLPSAGVECVPSRHHTIALIQLTRALAISW